jgi:hypothetical protein
MIRDPDSPLSFDLAAAFGRHQPGPSRGGRVMGLTTASARQRVEILDAKPIANIVHLVGNVPDQK